ncbi:MAG: BamA/OMP85 family outer membrane protein [Verrucomicrobiales bacterium]
MTLRPTSTASPERGRHLTHARQLERGLQLPRFHRRLERGLQSAPAISASPLLSLLLILFSLPLSAATIDIQGLRSFPAAKILEENAGRLEFIRKRPATSSRADDAAFLIEQHLRERGLPDAMVDWSLPGNNRILLSVDEGPPRYLGEVTLKTPDLPVSEEELIAQFRSPSEKMDEGDSSKTPFLPDNIPTGTRQAITYLHSLGYWDATAVATPTAPDRQGVIDITLQLKPGPLYKLAAPRLVAPRPPAASIRAKIAATAGLPASSENISKIRQTLVSYYTGIGYREATFQLSRKDENALTTLTLTIQPGEKFRLREVGVAGLEKTRPDRITKRFDHLEGENYDKSKLSEITQKLVATGAFERAELEEIPTGNKEIDVTLHLTETKARGLEFNLGAGSYEGYIVGARYYDRNWLGRLYNFNAGVEFTSLGVLGEVYATDPFFYHNDLTFTPRAYFVTREYEGYSKLEGGLGAELTWDVNKHYEIIFGLDNFFTTVQSEGLPDEALGTTDYLVTQLRLIQRYDRRDDPAIPSDGYYLQLQNALGIALGDESVSFFKTEGHASYYKSLDEKNALAFALRGGFIIPTGDQDRLPIDLRAFTGGANTVRSFPDRELGPTADGYPTGGNAWWVANAEYLRQIKGPVKAVAFLDAGALAQDYAELLSADIKLAAGLGLRIDLPIGPVRLEYGRALNPAEGDPGGTFHFAIGTTF